MRLDIEELTVGSIYVTVWASPLVPLHMGKTENAATMIKEHFGLQLQVFWCNITCFCFLELEYCSITLHNYNATVVLVIAASHRRGSGKGAR